jgi:hypothetical protein
MTYNRYTNGKIYQITNNLNDMIYIGSTCLPLRKRWYNHKNDERSVVTPYSRDHFGCAGYLAHHGVGLGQEHEVLGVQDSRVDYRVDRACVSGCFLGRAASNDSGAQLGTWDDTCPIYSQDRCR